MKNLFIITMLFCVLTLDAQSIEEKINHITYTIDSTTLAEKNLLEKRIAEVNKKRDDGIISYQQAEEEKRKLAAFHANKIETAVNREKAILDSLITKRVDDRIAGKILDSIEQKYDGKDIMIGVKIDGNKAQIGAYNGRNHNEKGEKRTTTQFVFGVGVNYLNAKNSALSDEMNVWNSRFWEYGITLNTRLSDTSGIPHLKYGLSLLYNNYKPKDNQLFTPLENKTILTDSNIEYKRNRFRNFYLNLPIHFELDFSPDYYNSKEEKIFKSHRGFRVGLGGYAGILVNSKNYLKYKDDEGKKVKNTIKDDYNVNPFNYGLSAYIGYKQISLYTKYDLQPLFENNPIQDHNFSVGLRWDIH